MPTARVDVNAARGSYPVFIGPGVLSSLSQQITDFHLGHSHVIVASTQAWKFHHEAFRPMAAARQPILLPDGERHKNLATVGRVYESLILGGADRSVVIIAVGGGVVGDLAGFVAATYLRGVRCIQVPTTLLAQVDSAVGGKVGVNHPLGKNLIGAFYPPTLVIADTTLVATLPRREFRAGLYEVIKYGVIASGPLLDTVEGTLAALFDRHPERVADIVAESCRIKAAIVSADEREAGRRRVLNFGHTVGHALEAVTRYRRYRHGEAVAYGMLASLALGVRRGITPREVERRVAGLIAKLGPLPPVSDLSAKEIIQATGRDKKVIGGRLHFIATTAIGTTTELGDVTEKELRRALGAIGVTRA